MERKNWATQIFRDDKEMTRGNQPTKLTYLYATIKQNKWQCLSQGTIDMKRRPGNNGFRSMVGFENPHEKQ
jgi:hypothetical protein